jgi:hypothetical protein
LANVFTDDLDPGERVEVTCLRGEDAVVTLMIEADEDGEQSTTLTITGDGVQALDRLDVDALECEVVTQ